MRKPKQRKLIKHYYTSFVINDVLIMLTIPCNKHLGNTNFI